MYMQEYETIVEFSFNAKQEQFVIRFLDGSSYMLKIADLPKKMQTKKPPWKEATLSPNRNSLVVKMEKEIREVLSHMIHSKGTLI